MNSLPSPSTRPRYTLPVGTWVSFDQFRDLKESPVVFILFADRKHFRRSQMSRVSVYNRENE